MTIPQKPLHKIQPTPLGKDLVTSDQPTSLALLEVAGRVGETALEESVAKKLAKSMPKQEAGAGAGVASTGIEKQHRNSENSEPNKKEIRRATSNPTVKIMVQIGVGLAVVGMILFFVVNMPLGVTITLSGCAVIIASVFLPVGVKKPQLK